MAASDAPAGDVDYAGSAGAYAQYRKPEPSIAALIDRALGDAVTVLNVGAGAGSYEPEGRLVTAVEPSAAMRAQRPPHLAAAIDALAENLPFPDAHFDAAMTTFSLHQWRDAAAGLKEMRRVTRGAVLVLTCDPDLVQNYWLNAYAPYVLAAEARRYPPMQQVKTLLGDETEIIGVPILLRCMDGFNEAYYGRPEMLLNPAARGACSAWRFVAPEVAENYVRALRLDIASGAWDRKYGYLRATPAYDGSLRLLIAGRPTNEKSLSVRQEH